MKLDLEVGVGHRQLGQPRADLGRELGRRLARGARDSSPASRSSSARDLLELGLAVLQRDLGALELVAALAAALGVGEHLGDRAAVLALQARELRQALLDLLERSGRRLAASALEPGHV